MKRLIITRTGHPVANPGSLAPCMLRHLILLCLLLLAVSCRKELCYNHWEHSFSVKAQVCASYEREWERDYGKDWQANWGTLGFPFSYDDLRPGIPEGLRVTVYKEDGSLETMNIPAEGKLLPLPEGKSSVLFYNNDTEYIVFEGDGIHTAISATTRTKTRTSILGGQTESEEGKTMPDMLYACFIDEWDGQKKTVPDEMNIVMKPLVYTYIVRYRVSAGMKYIKLARGALGGMAEAVYLSSGKTSLREGKFFYDCDVKAENGWVEAKVRTFGVHSFEDGSYSEAEDRRYTLDLDIMMTNGKMKETVKWDITEQMKMQPRGGVIEVCGVEVTEEEAAGGGIEVDIDGWGDYQDIEMPLS